MKIIYKNKKISQQVEIDEIYDHVDDDMVEEINRYNANDVDGIDSEALESGQIPVNLKGDDVGGMLADDQEDEINQNLPLSEEDLQQEVDVEDVPDSSKDSAEDAMLWAIENKRVVKIFYTTKGRGSRDEKRYLKREKGLQRTPGGGVSIYRIIEPHEIFTAGNGNRILVTYDRSVRRIRAFIVDNITDYNFTQNRVTKEPQHFKNRNRVMPKSKKGIKAMKNTKIMKLAQEIEDKGMLKTASIVRDAYKSLETLKTAQYVGAQGYWIRNRRCWDNCYRQKRTTEPNKAAQEVWTDCWEEYNKSINDNESGWEKYASGEKKKISSKDEKKWNKHFKTKTNEKIKSGLSLPESIYASLDECYDKYHNDVMDSSLRLLEVAEVMEENGMTNFGHSLAEISNDMVKEAGIWQGIKNVGKGISNMWNGGEAPEEAPAEAEQETMKQRLRAFIQNVSQIAQKIRNNIGYTQKEKKASGFKKIIIEAGKGSRIEKEAQLAPGVNPKHIQPKSFDPQQYNQQKTDQALADQQVADQQQQNIADQGAQEMDQWQQQASDMDGDMVPDNQDVDPDGDGKPGVSQPQPASQASVETIKKINSLMAEADDIAFWINSEALLEPQEKDMAGKVVSSLQKSSTEIRKHLTGGESNNESVAVALEKMVQDVTKALELVEKPASESMSESKEQQAPQGPQGPDGQQPGLQTSRQENSPGFQNEGESESYLPPKAKYPLTGDADADTAAVMKDPNMHQYINILNDKVGRFDINKNKAASKKINKIKKGF
jgi:hypothetical protein